MQEKQISLTLYSGDEATDKLMKSILDALNDYVMSLRRGKYSRSFNGTNSDKEVVAIINASPNPDDKSKKLHVSMNTYYKYKAELRKTLVQYPH